LCTCLVREVTVLFLRLWNASFPLFDLPSLSSLHQKFKSPDLPLLRLRIDFLHKRCLCVRRTGACTLFISDQSLTVFFPRRFGWVRSFECHSLARRFFPFGFFPPFIISHAVTLLSLQETKYGPFIRLDEFVFLSKASSSPRCLSREPARELPLPASFSGCLYQGSAPIPIQCLAACRPFNPSTR